MNNLDFADRYVQAADKNHQLLLSNYRNWLSPLLERTIRYIFAGESELAWRSFYSDYDVLSKHYPNDDYKNVKLELIQQNVEEKLADYFKS
jgi:hypothetical protein